MKGFTDMKDRKRRDTFIGIKGTTIKIQGDLGDSIPFDVMITKVNTTVEGDTRMMNIDLSPMSDTITANAVNMAGCRLEKHMYVRF